MRTRRHGTAARLGVLASIVVLGALCAGDSVSAAADAPLAAGVPAAATRAQIGAATSTRAPAGSTPGRHRKVRKAPKEQPAGTAANPGPTPTGSATLPPSVPSSFPSAQSTGVTAGVRLKSVSGNLTVTRAGSTVSGYDIAGGLVIKADDVTVRDVRVRCGGIDDFCVTLLGRGVRLAHAEVGGGTSGSSAVNAIGVWAGGDDGTAGSTQISYLDVHHTSDGLRVDGYTTVSDSYIHDLSYSDGAHSDGIQVTAGRSMVFRHNTFVGGTNCNLFLQPEEGGSVSGVRVEGNSFSGEAKDGTVTSFGLCVTPQVTDVGVTGNSFDRSNWQVGPATYGYPWTEWSGNSYAGGGTVARP